MAEYSRMASGQVTSVGAGTAVVLPFIPNFIEICNRTRATAVSGVTRAWWETDMGQGAAFITTTGAGPADGTSYITSATGTGFTTIQAGLALQYGPTVLLGASGGITKNSTAPVITTTANHGLAVGNVVVFSNLYQTSSTGMQQIAGIPFQVVTVPTATTFTINWNTNQTAYTAIATGGLNTLASFKQVLYPALYAPGTAVISAIGLGATTTIQTTMSSNVVVGQEVAFRIPNNFGTVQLNSLPDVIIPGQPIYGYVTTVTDSTNFTVNINSAAYTAFTSNIAFASFSGLKLPQVVPVGDVNMGGVSISATSQLYPSPTVFNGFQGSVTVPVSTINGPGILGSYINATFQGFLIGSGAAGTAGDVINWRAYMHDLNT